MLSTTRGQNMKFLIIFSFFLLLSSIPRHLLARDIVIIENFASPLEGETLVNLIHQNLGIPKKFINLYKGVLNCSKRRDAILHICLTAKGEMDIVKKNDDVLENLKNSFLTTGEKIHETAK